MKKDVDLPPDIAEVMKTIGINLTQCRKSKGIGYKKLAKEIDITDMTLWRMQQGKDFKMSTFLRVLKAIGISPEEFFKGIK